MDNCQIMSKQNLETWGIIKESFRIPAKNSTTFIPLAFLISLLPFTSLLFQHLLLHHASNAAAEFLADRSFCDPMTALCEINSRSSTPSIMAMIHNTSQTLFILAFLCLGIGHFFNLINTVIVVRSASLIYSGNEASSWKELIREANNLKGPLMTSLYPLALSLLTLVGLASFGIQFYISDSTFMVFFGLISVGLLIKYLEWSAIWNMGLVISILEGKHGYVGIGVSGYISRGNTRSGFLLMLIWSNGYLWGEDNTSGFQVLIGIGDCLGQLMKWVVCTVYYYDCKKRFLEKKVDFEQGLATEATKQ